MFWANGVDSRFSHYLVLHPPAPLRGTVRWRVESQQKMKEEVKDSSPTTRLCFTGCQQGLLQNQLLAVRKVKVRANRMGQGGRADEEEEAGVL